MFFKFCDHLLIILLGCISSTVCSGLTIVIPRSDRKCLLLNQEIGDPVEVIYTGKFVNITKSRSNLSKLKV